MENYRHYLYKIGEYGVATEVRHPLVVVNGLPDATIDEIVIFEDGQIGQVFSINRDSVDILLYTQTKVKNGASVTRTGLFISAPVGDNLLGQVINPLSHLNPNTSLNTETRPIDNEAYEMDKRVKLTQPFLTGTCVVDLMIPLGKGQRELIIGDRKTGKTSFLLTCIRSQIESSPDSVVIYCGIGKRQSEIKKIHDLFISLNIMNRIIMVASTSNDALGSIYITPYSAMTIAEYFRDKGKDVLIILDDLTYHAKTYREISLLSNRFPGRDAYPGDIFYLHSKLLERAGAFKHSEKGEVFITCLPIAETVEGDLRGYISTNLMGMTDGHIFFDSNSYFEGLRPAINILLSVTRVGRQTQTKLRKDINTYLLSFLSNYENLANFSRFGSELSKEVETILKRGGLLQALFTQHYKDVVPLPVQLIILSLIWDDSIQSSKDLKELRDTMSQKYEVYKDYLDNLLNCDSFLELVEKVKASKIEILNICKTA